MVLVLGCGFSHCSSRSLCRSSHIPSFNSWGPFMGVGDPDATGQVTLDHGMSHTLLKVSSTGECGRNGDCMSTLGFSIASTSTGATMKKSIVRFFFRRRPARGRACVYDPGLRHVLPRPCLYVLWD